MRLTGLIAIAVFFTLLVIRVGFESPAIAAETLVDPCTLLTQEDAGGAMNATSGAPSRRLSRACIYSASDNHIASKNTAEHRSIVIIRQVSPIYFGALARMGATPIPGLGDAAYSYYHTVFVKKGDTIIDIAMIAKPARKDLDQAVLKLAKTVVSRM